MVPISEYATVEIAPLIEAIQALEKAQGMYTGSKYQHRGILVLEKSGNIVGKMLTRIPYLGRVSSNKFCSTSIF